MGMVRTFISGLARFRFTPGKLSMLEDGRLTPARIAKYAVKGEYFLSEKSKHYIYINPKIHDKAVDSLLVYLNKEKWNSEVNCDALKPPKTYATYPTRERARKILEHLSRVGSNDIHLRIQAELARLPDDEEK